MLKTNPLSCKIKIKNLNGETIIGSFYEKELLKIIHELLSRTRQSY